VFIHGRKRNVKHEKKPPGDFFSALYSAVGKTIFILLAHATARAYSPQHIGLFPG
jgi:hypothetical protein